MKTSEKPLQRFYYKMVAKVGGRFLSIYDGKTEYILGNTMYEQAEDKHGGGFYVYPTMKQAVFADVPFNKDGLYSAPRTVLVCMCWGDAIDYKNGKIAFSYICPVKEFPLERGYLSTKAARRQIEEEKSNPESKGKLTMHNKIKEQLISSTGFKNKKKPEPEEVKTHELLQDQNKDLEKEILEMEKKLKAIAFGK